MSTRKYTPGPWKVEQERTAEFLITAEDGMSVAEKIASSFDARLIEQAPALLEALKELEDEMTVNYLDTFEGRKRIPEEVMEMLRTARAVIARAEGRS
jgi:hypothetical protein